MSLHMRGFIEYIYKGENMYKKKKNEKSNEYNRKHSRIFRWNAGLFAVLLCLSGCGKESRQEMQQMEEVYVEEARSDKPQSEKQTAESGQKERSSRVQSGCMYRGQSVSLASMNCRRDRAFLKRWSAREVWRRLRIRIF